MIDHHFMLKRRCSAQLRYADFRAAGEAYAARGVVTMEFNLFVKVRAAQRNTLENASDICNALPYHTHR